MLILSLINVILNCKNVNKLIQATKMTDSPSQATNNQSNNANLVSPWLHAWYDPLANLKTVPSLIRLGDLWADGDSKLLIADINKKIKVYKGTSLVNEISLLDNPVAACIVQTDIVLPRIPAIAIAASSYIFMYRSMRPFKKWTCPPTEPSGTEVEIWNQIKSKEMDYETAYSSLQHARDSGVFLTARSLDLLQIETSEKRVQYIDQIKDLAYSQQTLITCMETLHRDSDEIDGVSMCIVGTESGYVYILPPDVSLSLYLCRVQLKSVPVLMCPSGRFDIEWRVSIACRDNKLYTIKEGDVRGTAVLTGNVIDLGSQAVSMAKEDRNIWVATMDRNISCYTVRGKRTALITVNEDIADICVMSLKRSKVSHALLVGLVNGEIRMYHSNINIHTFTVEKPVIALRFGFYGREDNSLVCVHGKGSSLTIKILRRTADLEGMLSSTKGPPSEQDVPLNVPKKTKLFVEQTQRERDQAMDIHRAFQKDLCKLRLSTARSYVKTLMDGQIGVTAVGGSGRTSDIRLHVIVNGLGPKFLLKIEVQNAASVPAFGTILYCSCDPRIYTILGVSGAKRGAIYPIPILLPGPKHLIEMNVLSIDPDGRAGQIIIMMSAPDSQQPLLSAVVRMPASELINV